MTQYKDTQVSATGRVEVELSDGNGYSVKSFDPEEARRLATDVLLTLNTETSQESDDE